MTGMTQVTERRATAAALLALTSVSLLLTAWGAAGTALLYVNTAFVLLAPGWAVTARLRISPRSLAWTTAVGAGISMTLLVAQLMISTHWWHPTGALLALAALTFVALLPLARPRRRPGKTIS